MLFADAQDDEGLPENWPRKTAEPRRDNAIGEDTTKFDLNNSGMPQRAHYVLLPVPSDGNYWIIPPASLSAADAQTVAQEVDPEELRKRGFQVFAGDQTPYKADVYLTPFRKNKVTWFSAKYAINDLDMPTQVIMRPKPDGTQELVCAYQATPDL